MPDGVKVLVVDDEEEFVDALSQRLEVRGFTVLTAFNGDDALKTVREKPVDVVILDVLMPGKDGIQTLTEIKQLKPLVEVIMLTGHATVQTGIEGMKQGAFDYLLKPTDTEDLVAKINKANGRKSDHEERIRQASIDNLVRTRGW